MNSAAEVTTLINNYAAMGLTKAEMAIKVAEACLGWPYVWGGAGQYCTPANRVSYANRTSCPDGESKQIIKLCQVLNESRGNCDGCKWYPSGVVRFFDCRGFTRWVLQQVGITIQGAGATSQWNTAGNWTAKGELNTLPDGVVCCVFMQNQKDHKTMEHTGLYIGGGVVIHCSGEVKRGKITDRGWTHWAIPAGIEGDVPVPTTKPTLRRGNTGPYVVECQTDLVSLGYDIGKSGIDGVYGRATMAAVAAFQTANGLKSDGICGPVTWYALDAAVGPKPEPGETYYTVTIQHLDLTQAKAFCNAYPNATMVEEKG